MKKIVFLCQGLASNEAAGIHRVASEIIKRIDELSTGVEVELLVPADEHDEYHFANIKVKHLGVDFSKFGRVGIRITRYLFKNFFSTLYIRAQDCLSVDLQLQFPLIGADIIAIYDCRVNMFPEFYEFSKNQRHVREAMLKHQNRAVSRCKRIVTDSQTAKTDILKSYPDTGKSIDVIYCGWQHFEMITPVEDIINRLNLKCGDYFFSLGSRFPHKNEKWIQKAALKYPDRLFVVTGKHIESDMSEETKPQNLIYTGRLNDGEIKALMMHCKAFIQPSFYEGFGIPPLEAMSVGADCILSDIPVFREIYKNSVWYIDPNDYDNIDIEKILTQKKESNDIILEEFSWDRSARLLWAVLKNEASKKIRSIEL